MDLSYNSKQQRRFPKAILKLKFWFNTSEQRDADTIDDDNSTTKSRAEKILRSFKRTFRRGGSRYRDSKISHFDNNVDMQNDPLEIAESPSEIPPIPPPRVGVPSSTFNQNEESSPYIEIVQADKGMSLAQEHFNLSKYGWYWGPMTKREAEDHLGKEPDGAFLVRDSSSNNHIYTLSLRSYSHTIHTHIEYDNGTYSLGASLSRSSVPELIESALEMSKNSIFSYSVHRELAQLPIRLLKPISRNMEMRSLTYLCRFVIRQHCNVNAIEKLPLPTTLKQYLLQGQY